MPRPDSKRQRVKYKDEDDDDEESSDMDKVSAENSKIKNGVFTHSCLHICIFIYKCFYFPIQ